MTPHLTRDDAARWCAGLLDGPAAAALEAHAAACPDCQALLQAEARAEAQLAAAVRASASAPRPASAEASAPTAVLSKPDAPPLAPVRPLRRRGAPALGAGVGAALALAAALVLLLRRPPTDVPAPAPLLLAARDAGAPVQGLDVPHYEDGAALPPEALSAFHPFEL